MGPYPPPHGGVQTNLVAIRQFLRARGIACPVINLTRHRKEETDEVYYPESASQLLKLTLRLRPDIIHLHFGGNLTRRLVALAFVCSMIPRAKVVLTFHSGGYPVSEEGRRATRHSFAGFALRQLDRVIGVNQQLVEFFQKLGVKPDRIRLILPHALSAVNPADQLPPALQTFFSSHSPVLTTVGQLEPEYDLALQIEAMDLICKRFPKAGLVIIGSGSLEEELRKLISDKSYAGSILLGGDVRHAETLRAIIESNIFLRTTHFDGDSVSVREALHIGVPVIATDNGMRPEGVHLIPAHDINALHRAVDERLTNENGRRSLGEADERNIEAVFEVYQELMKG
jgi:glycosyltransferase involved in cell wall biosynthesis